MVKIPHKITLIELVVILWCGLIFSLAGGWTFPWIVFLIYVTVLTTIGGIWATLINGRKGFLAGMVFLLPCLIGLLLTVPMMFPTVFCYVHGVQYRNAKLSSVLSNLSQQKTTAPCWRFTIATRELADLPVTVDIPDNCRLGKALELIADGADCEFDWYWHKFCGNEPIPGMAVFEYRPLGTSTNHSKEPAVLIWQGRVRYTNKPPTHN